MAGNRKNELKALFGGGLAPSETPSRAPETKSMPEGNSGSTAPSDGGLLPRSPSGAVKAMGLSLGTITREAEEARALRQALNEGERIVTISPDKIDGSFVEDRLRIEGRDDEDFSALMDSIRETGQQVPVLLRPHPETAGRYQTAYGHRRIRAAARLGIEVKAVVRPLTDDELVLAQGKENAERRNLSFIERAMFAKQLERRGFDRKIIGDALAVQKSELSRLLAVMDMISETDIRFIGAAPKAGRARWMKLGEMMKRPNAYEFVGREMGGDRFHAADTDKRFQLVFDRLMDQEFRHSPNMRRVSSEFKDDEGTVLAQLHRKGKNRKIEFSSHVDDAFVDEMAELISERYAEFLARQSAEKS